MKQDKNDPTLDDRYTETFTTWNKIASLYQDRFMDLDLYNETYDFVCNAITKKRAKLLDVGCGPGNISRYLLSKRPDFTILGIDVAPNMVELAQKNNPTASFATLDIRQMDEIKTKYDGIVCGFCLPYLAPAACTKFISDCSQLLNEGGLLYLSFVAGDPAKSGFQTGSNGDRSYFYFYNLNDLNTELTERHFADFKIFELAYKKGKNNTEIHTIIIARKKQLANGYL